MCCSEQVSNNMSTIRKRKYSNQDEQDNERDQSSYAKMKMKMNNDQHELEQLRMELEQHRNKRGGSKGGQSSYAKLKMQMQSNHEKLAVCEDELVQVRMDLVKVRSELQETQRQKCEFEAEVHLVRTELEKLTKRNEEMNEELKEELEKLTKRNEEMNEEIKELKRGMGLRWLHMERLKATITEGTIRYDAMVANVEQYERTMEQESVQKCKHKRKHTRMAVCRAFGWSLQNVDPVLLRAACGFWDATTLDAESSHRASVKMREDIWYQLTCLGFKGKVLKKMEKGWKKLHKFDAHRDISPVFGTF